MKHAITLATVLSLLPVIGAAAETRCGAALCLSELTEEQSGQVLDMVARARVDHPSAFDGIARIRADMTELDIAKTGRFAVVGPFLQHLGDGAVPAMVERLVIGDEALTELGPDALQAWRIGLLDALGKLRDNRAAAVLEAVCRNEDTDIMTLTAAASALARLETDESAAVLLELANEPAERGHAVLAGMGHCRRLAVTRRLADALPHQTDPARHRDVARSLATAANGLVWRSGLARHREEGAELREIAARVLFEDYTARPDAFRHALLTALLVVDHPDLAGWINDRRTNADPTLDAVLGTLVRRLESNPVSRMAAPEH